MMYTVHTPIYTSETRGLNYLHYIMNTDKQYTIGEQTITFLENIIDFLLWIRKESDFSNPKKKKEEKSKESGKKSQMN